jgi:CHAT domain-containing protein
LPVELITLSGCGTGLSEIAAGDELLGLTRGLLTAGAQSLLVTLWDVHDQTTANFMRLFYLHSADTKDKAAALRNSMLELRQHVRHPYYWAPFILIGNRNNA